MFFFFFLFSIVEIDNGGEESDVEHNNDVIIYKLLSPLKLILTQSYDEYLLGDKHVALENSKFTIISHVFWHTRETFIWQETSCNIYTAV